MAAEQGVRSCPLAMLHLIRTFVVPQAMFACQVWGTAYLSQGKWAKAPPQLSYTALLRHVIGVRKSISGDILMCELAQAPLQFYCCLNAPVLLT